MKHHLSKILLFSLSITLGLYLLMPEFQLMAQDSRAAKSDQQAEPTSPEEVDRHLAGMSDEQVRQAYAQQLKQDAEKQSAASPNSEQRRSGSIVIDSFYRAARIAAANSSTVTFFNRKPMAPASSTSRIKSFSWKLVKAMTCTEG